MATLLNDLPKGKPFVLRDLAALVVIHRVEQGFCVELGEIFLP